MARNLLPPTVDQILDDILAGKITRDEAAERIRSIMSTDHHKCRPSIYRGAGSTQKIHFKMKRS